uniref:At1g61320/AtMIF1 LRR domain-containing protein n=1 Tax=Oryza brachyantha TaxID=4533 RepID=J3M241_ORYBR
MLLTRLRRLISLRHLTLDLNISDLPQRKIDVLELAYALKAAPFMEKLELNMVMIGRHRRYCPDDGELRSLASSPHSHLSWVHIGFVGEKDQLELALHILHNAMVLKEMIIDTSSSTESVGVYFLPECVASDGYSVALEFLSKQYRNNIVCILEVDEQ